MNFDILIRNGRVIDGAGNPWYKADVGITSGKIAKIGRLDKESATTELDAADMVICPGFIDPHSHSDFVIPFDPRGESTIRQGITTLVVGQCGDSMAPINPEKKDEFKKLIDIFVPPGETFNTTWHWFKEYIEAMEKIGSTANVACLVGFGTIRIAGGPGFEDRPPTDSEMEKMKKYVAEAMEAGAFGLSTGLIYTPQVYARTDEVIELAKVAAQYNGLYFSHIRNEGGGVVDAVNEAIEITEKSGCVGGHIGHHKIAGKPYWGTSVETMKAMEEANARGLNITCDQYPYIRGMSSLITLLPPWVHIGGIAQIVERLKDPNNRERIKIEIMEGIEGWENWIKDVGFDRIFITSVKTDPWMDILGKSITEITQLKNKPDNFTTLFDLLVEEAGEVTMTIESMGEEDIRRIMTGRFTMIGTDGWGVAPTGVLSRTIPHPRFYGTFPRVLSKYVRDDKLMPIEIAIRKMTSFAAQKLSLWDRGLIREGMAADIVIFNQAQIRDQSTFEDPHQFSEGIHHVIVNGELVVKNNTQTEKLPGKFLRYTP